MTILACISQKTHVESSMMSEQAKELQTMKGTGTETILRINRAPRLPVLKDSNDREVLLAVQKYCTYENCFQKEKLGKEMNDFHSRTKDMMQDEAKKRPPSPERVFTIVSNYLLMLNNAYEKKLDKPSVNLYDTSVAMKQLDKSWNIAEKYSRILKSEQKEKERSKLVTEQKRRRVRRVKKLIAAIFVLMLLIFVSGFFLPKEPDPVEESKPFYTAAYDWVRHEVFGVKDSEKPVPFSEQYRPYTVAAGIIFLAMSCICVIGVSARAIYHRSETVHRKRIKSEWGDYQLLRTAFAEVEKETSEMEE